MKNRNAVIFGAVWLTIIVVVVVDILWARVAGFSIMRGWPISSISPRIWVSLVATVALALLSYVPRYSAPTKFLRCREIAFAILFLVSVYFWGQAMSVVSYLGTALNRPTIEIDLIKFDAFLGFGWLNAYHWVSSHPWLAAALRNAYFSAYTQLVVLSFVLAFMRRVDDLSELMAIMVVSLILVMVVSIPYPAASAFLHYGISEPGTSDSVRDFALLRSGDLKVINPMAVQGLVSMPSFHTMMALFFIYSVRNIRLALPAVAVLNVIMISSTITVGGHYLADVLAGIVCGVAVILAVRRGLRLQFDPRGGNDLPLAVSTTGKSSASAL
ncbi:phosphatase PAP2 family protein [Burkholderia cepacia]|uniref:phosphatase PAP2 family protein n=2 Tax=Burkholderia cepacia TaxID=292 RepID=UPI0009BD1321|nr:phosphatase PAP2 family protein [Burkholderia cepacia]KAB1591286.1 phosphatase PAP2 family protein [Burkholderia cepacia]RQT65451.1 PAP2 family protein [Burkholderia cepacia]RQT74182.1 PAP2 family protein [Burkholderia cepacia]